LVQMRICAISILILALPKLGPPQTPKTLLVRRLCTCVRRSLAPIFGFLGCSSECLTLRYLVLTLSFCPGLGGVVRIHPPTPPMLTCTSLPLWTLAPLHMQGLPAALSVGPWLSLCPQRQSQSRSCFRLGTSLRPVSLLAGGLHQLSRRG